jgi:hypothetical protein
MTRPANPSDPTADERGRMPEQGDREDQEIIPRTREERGTTPRRYEHADDKALPSDDPTYRTEI